MATIAENLQTLVDQKAAIKTALENKGKAPTEQLDTYAGLIEELENEEQISYVLTNSDGTKRAYAVKTAEEAVTLTATENDIRKETTAITNTGYTEGQKDIPAYRTQEGRKIIQSGGEMSITLDINNMYDYTYLQIIINEYNTSISDSVATYAVVINDAVYEANSTTKLADITKDADTLKVNLGITAEKKTVLRYFTMREE